MSGIYLHIPFCKQKCHYCDFHFAVSLKRKDDILECISKEIRLRKAYFNEMNPTINTIYFGGGTPSILSANEINYLLDEIGKHFDLTNLQEVTLECNPDDLSPAKLRSLRATAINRLSIGIQSFSDDDLRLLNRVHTAEESISCVQYAQDAGFENLNIDLIYGLPGMDIKSWQKNLDQVDKLQVSHLSCYALTIEKRTAFHHFIQSGKMIPSRNEHVIQQFEQLITWADSKEFVHYEISNFAQKGALALHNTNYWKGAQYLGIGPSAHSYNGMERSWNIANNAKYIQSLKDGILPLEREVLKKNDHFNEYILTRLRTMWGVERKQIIAFGQEYLPHFIRLIEPYITSGHVLQNSDKWHLTKKGKFIADRITSDVFMDIEE